MTERVRVYHPETDEPFDVTPAKAAHLRLDKGWRAQPLSPDGERAVTTLDERGTGAGAKDWRDTKVDEKLTDDQLAPVAAPVTRNAPRAAAVNAAPAIAPAREVGAILRGNQTPQK